MTRFKHIRYGLSVFYSIWQLWLVCAVIFGIGLSFLFGNWMFLLVAFAWFVIIPPFFTAGGQWVRTVDHQNAIRRREREIDLKLRKQYMADNPDVILANGHFEDFHETLYQIWKP